MFEDSKLYRERRESSRQRKLPPAETPPDARQSAQKAKGKPQAGTGKRVERRGAEKRQMAPKRLDKREPRGRPSAQPAEEPPNLLSNVIIWCVVAIGALLILATSGEAWTVYRLNQQITANQQAAAQLQAQNQQLSSSVQQLQQASTVEQEARRLGFIFPGDQPVVVVTATPPAAPVTQAAPPAPNWWGFWPDWLKLFFGG